MTPTNLTQWLAHIQSFHPEDIELGLTRIQQVAHSLGLLKPEAKIITVGGTNGKGSCVASLESFALCSGLTVGCYTSPHILYFNERVRLNGNNVSDSALINAFELIEDKRGDIALTFFEFTTLAALLIFQQSSLDIIVLEVGLGGRLDAVNIIEPDVAIITTIDRDHADWLGTDLANIAKEKSGIFRVNKPALVGDQTAFDLVKSLPNAERWQLSLAPLATEDELKVIADSRLNPYQLMAQNILLAKQAFDSLYPQSDYQFKNVVSCIKIQGRFEQISQQPVTIIDVAHNPQATQHLSEQISDFKIQQGGFSKTIAICGMMKDKSIKEVFETIKDNIDYWHMVNLNLPRAESAENLVRILVELDGGVSVEANKNVSEAYRNILQLRMSNILVIIFGSFITVSDMLQYQQNSLSTSS